MKESDIMRQEQLKASQKGDRLFRNNVGVYIDTRGIPVRYGLGVGSADLIGVKRILVTQEMVGTMIGQFWSVEIKSKRGNLTQQQIDWRDAINASGGHAEVIYGE